MNATIIAIGGALPWIVIPLVTAIRVRNSKSLNDESAEAPVDAPLVSVIIPARNEANNIERCIRSVLTTTYPAVEVVVVDDQSDDGTGDIARSVSAEDPRVRVVGTDALPEEWFGKQWACATGARAARGEILCFADADTTHFRELLTRSVNAIQRRRADLFSVGGRQEMGGFWEKIVQPQVFVMMAARYGGTESINESPRVSDKIANGQCLFVRRVPYEELGGHGLVKSHVADDLMMAQRFFARGKNVVIEEGLDHLSTRMYTSLGELIRGWGKNVFAGGRDSAQFGRLGRAVYPVMLLSAPLIGLVPALVLLASLVVPLPPAMILWAAIASAALLVWWLFAYRQLGESPLYAFLSPLGAAMVLYIFLRAVMRGQKVTWKGREYLSG